MHNCVLYRARFLPGGGMRVRLLQPATGPGSMVCMVCGVVGIARDHLQLGDQQDQDDQAWGPGPVAPEYCHRVHSPACIHICSGLLGSTWDTGYPGQCTRYLGHCVGYCIYWTLIPRTRFWDTSSVTQDIPPGSLYPVLGTLH